MKLTTSLAFAAVLTCCPAIAADSGKYTCLGQADWGTLDIEKEGVRFNNFSMRSAPYFFDREKLVANLTFSVTNRAETTVYVKGEFIFFDDQDAPVFAINAVPRSDSVSAGTTDTASGEVFMEEGEFSQVQKVCYFIGGKFS
ncbi:hypothetical protein [Roseibium alexandrii]|uniref:Uncharacterized protein n=1 Tax=Roseibium alexandrii TaxID=388408 RepID=A0A0M7ARY5_9HYPH|nr:hypothetical protein [Roseibium alexandrii]CTQ77417.1 hypothetical protein LAX5112_04903 [Roseibium alexandrii]